MANLEQIQNYLQLQKLSFKIVVIGREAFTVEDVVRAGIDEDEIVKTLIIRINGIPSTQFVRSGHSTLRNESSGSDSKRSTRFVALALCGNDRVDFKKVRRLFGSKSELAKPEEVLRVVGVPIGAVCPVLVGIPLYFDRKVMDLRNAHMGSGDLKHGLEMELLDLLKACGDYEVSDLAI